MRALSPLSAQYDERAALRERWQQAKAIYPALALSAHQALRAIQAEEKAEAALATLVPSNPLDVYQLCDALAGLALALETWAYVSARLWHLCQTEQEETEIKALHHTSVEQYARLLDAHLQAQERLFAFCQQHQIILRFGVMTQAFDMSNKARSSKAEVDSVLREEGHNHE